jgi:lipopolysaccharide export system protein LptC
MTILRSEARPAIAKIMLVATIAALLFAMSEPSFAARKSRKPAENSPTPRSEKTRTPAYDPQGTSRNPFGPGRNLPYPDRPYGDPGRW